MSSSIVGVTRSISACKRCRQKKVKCSHEFPKCKACKKANVECVSLDPATGREIPRSYIVHLEEKIMELEKFIKDRNLKIDDANNTQIDSSSISQESSLESENTKINNSSDEERKNYKVNKNKNTHANDTSINNEELINSINSYRSTSQKGESSVPTTFSGDGISFSKLMFAAVHFKGSRDQKTDQRRRSSGVSKNLVTPIDPTTSSKSSFSENVALLPPKQQALDFISLYFSESNSQLPIFHREEFLKNIFIPIYGEIPQSSTIALNYPETDWSSFPKVKENDTWYCQYTRLLDAETAVDPDMDPFKFSAKVNVPKRFRKSLYFINIIFALASSTWHLKFSHHISENFKNAALLHIEEAYSSNDRLEALQAMLSLTLYSLMRPCVPGVWYLLGSSMRLCIDLGLHNESLASSNMDAFTIDMRRRLFWCCYSLDRQICVYLGRPFGIPEESIKVDFPSILDDEFIKFDSTKKTLYENSPASKVPSYKNISMAMFKIRKLQAEVQSILYDNRTLPREFDSLTDWTNNMTRRLKDWKFNIPKTSKITNCDFSTEFFELNYYHTTILLHGLSPARYALSKEDFVNVAEASKGVLLTFHKLWNRAALNYTWAVTQNVFMSQMSFLYAVFNSEDVLKITPLSEIEQFAIYSNRILKSLIVKCNAAKKCLEVLTILARAVIKLKYKYEESSKINTFKTQISNTDMARLPSEEEIQTLQAGGNVTGNMRRLIVSIPELINSEEKMSLNKQYPKRSKNNNSGYTARLTASELTPPQHKSNMPVINRPESRQSENSDTAAESLWSINGFDLDNFFESVKRVESPYSSRSISENSVNDNGTSCIRGAQSSSLSAFNSNQRGSTNDEKYSLIDESNTYGWKNGTSLSIPTAPQFMGTQFQSKPHSINSPIIGTIPDFTSINHPMPFYNISTGSPMYSSSNGTPVNQYQNIGDVINPVNFPPIKTDETALNKPTGYNVERKDSKEGQRVFKLMFETGTESIWDQFFAQPFKLDEI